MKKALTFTGLLLAASLILAAWLYGPPVRQPKPQEEKPPQALLDTSRAQDFASWYGYLTDGMVVHHQRIRRHEFLATILQDHHVPAASIRLLAERAKGVFDIRKMGVGKPYELICFTDSSCTAKAMIYHPNEVDYVVFHLRDSVYVRKGSHQVVVRQQRASGVINQSLAVSMAEQGLGPQLTNDLADIFSWEIDFFRLYPGDKYKLIYEEKFVNGRSVGYGAIKAAVFEHGGKPYYAFAYDQGEGVEYFDPEGKSLRKTFLKYPVKFTRISSRYSGRRFHPVQKRYKAHRGTDFAAPQGTPIRAVGDGVVLEARYNKYNGNYVKIKHNSVYSTQYLHMVKIASGIRPGVKVKQGQTIGYVGHTGLARGNHVCYRFWKYGQQVDALKVDLPSAAPVKEENLPAFRALADSLRQALDTIAYPPSAQAVMAGE
ncbi:MAG TPA: peptidase M23 [Flammeovirgaceae bacterium]|nr:peptidase M23 [Flammeovirgaceae bacterium]